MAMRMLPCCCCLVAPLVAVVEFGLRAPPLLLAPELSAPLVVGSPLDRLPVLSVLMEASGAEDVGDATADEVPTRVLVMSFVEVRVWRLRSVPRTTVVKMDVSTVIGSDVADAVALPTSVLVKS